MISYSPFSSYDYAPTAADITPHLRSFSSKHSPSKPNNQTRVAMSMFSPGKRHIISPSKRVNEDVTQ